MRVREVGWSGLLGLMLVGLGCGEAPPTLGTADDGSSSGSQTTLGTGTSGATDTTPATSSGETLVTATAGSSETSETDSGSTSAVDPPFGDSSSGTGDSDSSGPTSFCGDGTLDADEECDDRNQEVGDGCSAACLDEDVWCEVVEVGSGGGYPLGQIAAEDGFVYFADGPLDPGPSLRVFDGTAATMVEVGSVEVDLPNWQGDNIQVKDSHVAVGGRYTGFVTVDVSNPEMPEVVFTEYQGGEGGDGPVIGGDLLAIGHPSNSERVQVWDVSDMANPSILVGYIGWAEQNFTHLAVVNEFVVLVGPPFLELWDVSTPANPMLVAQPTNVQTSQVQRVLANEDSIVVVGFELLHVDYSTPSVPQVSELDLDLMWAPPDMAMRGNLLYVPVTNGLQVWDIADPAAPILASVYLEPSADSFAVALDDEHAYIATEFGLRKVAGLPGFCDARCGNSHVEYPEDCDDGNLQDGDGCTSTCNDE